MLYFSKECHLPINATLNKDCQKHAIGGGFVSHLPCFDWDQC